MTPQTVISSPELSAAGRFDHIRFPAAPVGLRSVAGGPSEFAFDFRLVIATVAHERARHHAWQVVTQTYEYRLLDRHEHELLVYHWHPLVAGPSFPHLHVSASLDAQYDALTRRRIDLDKRHLATGQVSLAAFARTLISEFEVLPLRQDWDARLAAADGH